MNSKKGTDFKKSRVYMVFGSRQGPQRNIGKIVIELFDDVVPRTVANFMALINGFRGEDGQKKEYRGCKLHRIIPNFVIQGGDFTRGDGSGGESIYGRYFEDENFIVNHTCAGLLSMANSGPNTNGSQFFITLAETPWLDNKHVVFGKVIDGMNVLKKIENYGTEGGTPKDTVKIIDCGIMYKSNKVKI